MSRIGTLIGAFVALAALAPGVSAGAADPVQAFLSPKGPCAGNSPGDACSASLAGKPFVGVCVALPVPGLACVPPPPRTFCGDGVASAEAGEQCDAGGAGSATCNINCTISVCGDGIVNPSAGEQCDSGELGVDTFFCNMSSRPCRIPQCGDGILNLGEQCDDGNGDNTDACSNSCQSAVCGDGILNLGEQCDDGNFVDNDGCSEMCEYTCGQ